MLPNDSASGGKSGGKNGQDLSPAELENLRGNSQIDKLQRKAFLKKRGIDPNAQVQLDLLFPQVRREDLRHIPNDIARSSLFTTCNKNQPRRALIHAQLFHYSENVSLRYTGAELRAEDDELVWLQILQYARSVAMGEPFEFYIKDLVRDVNWSKSGRNYDRARECISRLKASELLALNSKAYGRSGAISLIHNYQAVNDSDGKITQYRVWIDPSLIVMFAGDTFTSHKWALYRNLSPVARRLADYIESHQFPFPLELEKFRKICGSSNSEPKSWRRIVKQACVEVQNAKIVDAIFVKDDQICCVRCISKT